MAYLSSWKWLSQLGPGFSIPGSTIRVLTDPEVFYSVLVEKARTATKRVSLASLYIGNGHLEKNLLSTIQNNLTENHSLKVNVLLDCSRGSRGQENSRALLVPLLRTSDSCQVFLYHTPALRGIIKKWLPQRWEEVIGLQHMKVYIFDDSLLITGANLSHDYFTNRQDRYILVERCESLADFYDGLINKVSEFSLQLNKDNELNLSSSWNIHPSTGDQEQFISQAKRSIVSYYENYKADNSSRLKSFFTLCDNEKGCGDLKQQVKNSEPTSSASNFSSTATTTTIPDLINVNSNSATNSKNEMEDTWVFPMIQMGPLGIGWDNYATNKIFEDATKGSHIKLATGYFNLTAEYIEKIIDKSSADYDILMAHPKANGFLGAKGFAGGIPAGYTLLATMFYNRVKSSGQQKRIAMWEYIRPNWTFHAKGLWFYPTRSSTTLPLVTLIGSPNFGYRSVDRDLETQLYVITKNPQLQQQLHDEQHRLYESSTLFSAQALAQPDRIVPLWCKLVIRFFRNFF